MKFDHPVAEISAVSLLAGNMESYPKFKARSPFRYVIVSAGDEGIALDVMMDSGFDIAVESLKRAGWKIDEAVGEAQKFSLIRRPVAFGRPHA